ncbi:hypothetical protein [Cylindrospermum sp. FACHB-282]|uniref:hypothetical protein n=1 Tax=Cylindrospermum sp. FACHB-282 TaxID=2692794 RepID=UPI0016876919|nr:hypothetical protein [Cylindrospermum sp. FACHB-282]MBD2385981.1 hypothetical protein [Cylindrospermum sp. FACHB-282]
MPTAIENQFVHNYSKLLIQAWTDRTFMARLEAQPTQVLKEFGIAIPPNARIDIVKQVADPSSASLKVQVDGWKQVEQTGVLQLFVPQQPQLFQQTSSGATEFDVQDVTACCCCCPCCTCT